ncbi:class I adenylate-forming enzyme family protein [Halobacteriales archaeon Cl-PHB]
MSTQTERGPDGLTFEAVQESLAPTMREADTVKDVIETAADRWPNEPYLTDATTGKAATYGEVESRATAVAAALADVGVQPGDKVGLYLENSVPYVHGIYACAKLGVVQTPINWQYREREVRHAVDTADVSTVVVQPDPDYLAILDEVVPEFEDLDTVVVIDEMADQSRESDVSGSETHDLSTLVAEGSAEPPAHDPAPEDQVSILYTSGTTGLPKPALHSNESYLLSAKSFLGAPLAADDVNYNPFPLFHANNQCYGMLAKAIHGSEWVFADKFSGSAFMDHATEYGVTSFNILGGVVQMLRSTYEEREIPANDLELAIGPIGTEQWTPFEEQFDVDVIQLYSQTENPVLLLNYPDLDGRAHGAMGKPMFPDLGHEVKLVDEDGQEVDVGENGHLLRTTVGAMTEYLGMPEKTAETVRDGWLHSGDIARADEDGFYYYVDRKKFMVRRAGENISAREVENVIDELPGVEASAIIPAPHDVYGEVVKAQVKRTSDGVTEQDVVMQVARELAAYKVPRYVEFVDDFPRTPSERIQRVQLADEEEETDDHGWDREAELPDWEDHI